MRRRTAIVTLASGIGVLLPAAGLDGQTFTASTTLVTVPATVSGGAGGTLVTGLGADDFRVFEEGVEQQIHLVNTARQPVSVCLVLDRSGSIGNARKEASERLVDLLLEQLPADDEVSLVSFGGEHQRTVELDWVRAGARVRVAWKHVPIGGSSAITDALALAMRQLDRATKPRRVVLALSDGRETGSATSIGRLATTRRQSETTLYAFGLELNVVGMPANMQYLRATVGDSGGYVHVVRSLDDVTAAVHDLMVELASQYVIGYAPSQPFDGKYRRIKVTTINPTFRVRHRGGYLARP